MNETLIWQQVYLQNEGQGRLFSISNALIKRLNPDCDVMVIDNGSPLDPKQYAEANLWFRFDSAIGHYFHGGINGAPPRDGPGRAHSVAWSIAIAAGYARAAYVEADCLFSLPVRWMFERMTKPIGAQPACKYYAYDWHVWAVNDLRWFKDFDFVGKYDWPSRVGEQGGEPAGEILYQRIFGDHLEALPIRGERGDAIGLTVENYDSLYPDGCDIITHVDTDCYAHFLKQNGHADLIERFHVSRQAP